MCQVCSCSSNIKSLNPYWPHLFLIKDTHVTGQFSPSPPCFRAENISPMHWKSLNTTSWALPCMLCKQRFRAESHMPLALMDNQECGGRSAGPLSSGWSRDGELWRQGSGHWGMIPYSSVMARFPGGGDIWTALLWRSKEFLQAMKRGKGRRRPKCSAPTRSIPLSLGVCE